MDYSLHYPTTSLTPSSPTSRPTKVIQQRQYREKESELFNILRVVIYDLTEEQLQTRQEILRKAIDLLSAALETKKLEDTEAVHPGGTSCLNNSNDVRSTYLGSSVQSSGWLENPQSPVEFEAQTAYYPSLNHAQHYHLMSDMGNVSPPVINHSQGSEDWPHHFSL